MKKHNYSLKLSWLYPDLMSTYGDRGNITVFMKRSEWRGIKIKLKTITQNSKTDELLDTDLIFMGGGEDRQQKIVAHDLEHKTGNILETLIQKGIPGLYICGAFQLLGKFYKEADGTIINGLNIFDIYTENPNKNTPRLIGDSIASLLLYDRQETIVGFENHGGRTYLGENIKPLGKVIKGYGNNGQDGYEGAIYKNSLGTYFHGPLLPKNPIIADYLLTKALEIKYKKKIVLTPLDDTLAKEAQSVIARRLSITV